MTHLQGSPEAAAQLRKAMVYCYSQIISQYKVLDAEMRKLRANGRDQGIDRSENMLCEIRKELVTMREPLQKIINRLVEYQKFLEQLDTLETQLVNPLNQSNTNSTEQKNGGVRARSIVAEYGFAFTQEISERMKAAPATIRAIWNRYAGNFKIGSAESDEAYYSPGSMAIYLDIEASAAGNAWSEPYNTVFHEHGHCIDHLMNRVYGTGDSCAAYSTTFEGGSFAAMLRLEAQDTVADFAQKNGLVELTYSEQCAAFADYISEKLSIMERADISDMFEPYLGIEYPMGVGHGTEYWDYVSPAEEAFAEMYAANVAGSASLVQIKRYFPRSYAIFERMLGAIQ